MSEHQPSSAAITAQPYKLKKLQTLPVNLFASVMGIAGLSLAWRTSTSLFNTPAILSHITGLLALVIFIVLAVAYTLKFLFHRAEVISEFKHPIAGNFFGTFPIAILLLSAVIRPFNETLALVLWVIGSVLIDVLAYVIVTRLIKNRQDFLHATPVWIIPGVGTLDVAVTTSDLPYTWIHELNMFNFAVGSVLALVFFVIIFSRLMHYEPLPERMTPSLLILMAPFAVGFLAYTNITHSIDMFAGVLFYFGVFMFLVLFFKIFNRKVPFMLTWWAVGFPVAALCNAALKFSTHVKTEFITALAVVILIILNVVIAYIFVRSMHLLAKGKLLSA